jgi:thiol-disulfide isomerase/thioredoxin
MKAALGLIIATVVCAIATVSYFMIGKEDENTMQSAPAISLSVQGPMPSLDGATAWLNSDPLTNDALRGKVVLIDFWTYSCINWRREFPYVRAWAEKYRANGLVVIGVHTPEFPFEKDLDNIRRAVEEIGVAYPVAVDSDYAIWNAFRNRYWPALYFVDARGNIRHHQFGEGDYDKSERVLQQLLREAGSEVVDDTLVSPDAGGAEAAADWENLGSPELYAGYDRTRNFESPGGERFDTAHGYEFPSHLRLNQWALAGTWTIRRGSAESGDASGRVRVRFRARDLHIVMGPGARSGPIRFRILIDGQPPVEARGVDIDEHGNGAITEPRMYQLIRQTRPVTERTFEIEFLDAGAAIYSFTFG